MTAEERLSQLELLVAESLGVLDRHTAQLKQLQNSVGQLISASSQHSDTLSFLLREQLAMKGDIAEMKGDIAEMKGDIAEIKSDIVEMRTHQVSMDGKLDQILNLLQKPGA